MNQAIKKKFFGVGDFRSGQKYPIGIFKLLKGLKSDLEINKRL